MLEPSTSVAGSLSERKVGALIVFERETRARGTSLRTGVHVNGDVTAEMLATIFIPGSPLHDRRGDHP